MTGRTTKQLLAAAGAALAALAYFMLGRSYPWQLALMMAGAVGALVFSSLQASGRLRNLDRRDDDD